MLKCGQRKKYALEIHGSHAACRVPARCIINNRISDAFNSENKNLVDARFVNRVLFARDATKRRQTWSDCDGDASMSTSGR